MAFLQVTVDLNRVATALEALVVILERAFPEPEIFEPAPLSDEERAALGFTQHSDEQAWREEVEARRARGETDADIAWRAYAPRS